MKASQVMTRCIVTCSPQDSLEDAARKMWDHDIGCLPVVDGDGRAVGFLTDRDACMGAFTQGGALTDIRVEVSMAHGVFSCHEADSIQHVEAVMRQHKVRRIPVLDRDGRLVGLISLNDLIRETAAERKLRHPDIAEDELVTTLACISEPRFAPPPHAAAAE